MEVGNQRGMVRRTVASPFGVVDPGGVEPAGQLAVGGDQVEAPTRLTCTRDALQQRTGQSKVDSIGPVYDPYRDAVQVPNHDRWWWGPL
jgi:hypothetical protein